MYNNNNCMCIFVIKNIFISVDSTETITTLNQTAGTLCIFFLSALFLSFQNPLPPRPSYYFSLDDLPLQRCRPFSHLPRSKYYNNMYIFLANARSLLSTRRLFGLAVRVVQSTAAHIMCFMRVHRIHISILSIIVY